MAPIPDSKSRRLLMADENTVLRNEFSVKQKLV
jgi:hypothetical protein